MDNKFRIALLVDAENVSKKYIKLIMDEISEYGVVTYKRVYGDFTVQSVLSWKDNLRDYAMTPIFQINYTKGKSASDSVMVIDAMDILYSGNVNGFCLVTSDSDFTKLAVRLREAGMLVIGMGEKKTPASLVAACETFKFLDLLYNDEEDLNKSDGEITLNQETETEIDNSHVGENVPDLKSDIDSAADTHIQMEKATGSDPGTFGSDTYENSVPDREMVRAEIGAIVDSYSVETGWINLASIGNLLPKRVPGFDPRNYGFKKLKELIESYDCFEIQEIKNPKKNFLTIVYVKNK